jgi:hypothetical protein
VLYTAQGLPYGFVTYTLTVTTGAAIAAPLEKFGGIQGVYLTVAVAWILIAGLVLTIDTQQTRRILGEEGAGA